jgi:hypothetical protein
MNKQGSVIGIVLIVFVLLVATLFVWGYIGGQEAKKVGVTCDTSVGSFCWKWHTNIVGQIINGVNNALGG